MAFDGLGHALVLQSRQSLSAGALFLPILGVNVSNSLALIGCARRTPLWSGSKFRACPVGFTRHISLHTSVDSLPSNPTRGQEERSTLTCNQGGTFRTAIRGATTVEGTTWKTFPTVARKPWRNAIHPRQRTESVLSHERHAATRRTEMKHAKKPMLRVWLFRPSQAMERGALLEHTNLLGLGNLPIESTRSKQDKQLTRNQEKAWANLLMRTSLSRTCEGLVPPEAFVFAREPRGKPMVDWEHTLFRAGLPSHSALPGRVAFNMTHTDGMMACATLYHTHERWDDSSLTVGIDLESIQRRPRKGVEALAQRRLAGPEAKWILQSLSEEEKAQRFLEIWTLKEAYLKATGDGLSSGLGLKKFCINFQDENDATVANAGQDRGTSCLRDLKSSKGARRMHILHEAISANNHTVGSTTVMAEAGGLHEYVGDATAEGWQSVLFEVEQTHLLALCYNLQWSKVVHTGHVPHTSDPMNCSLELVSTIPLLGPDRKVDARMLASTL